MEDKPAINSIFTLNKIKEFQGNAKSFPVMAAGGAIKPGSYPLGLNMAFQPVFMNFGNAWQLSKKSKQGFR